VPTSARSVLRAIARWVRWCPTTPGADGARRRVEGVTLLRRVRAWLFAPSPSEPDGDELIELTRFSMRLDAELAVNDLQLHGIRATLFAADAEGWAPHLGMAQGNRVMVAHRDVRRAAEVIAGTRSDESGGGSTA